MMGDIDARCNLAANEGQDGNQGNFMIPANSGHDNSLDMIKQGYSRDSNKRELRDCVACP